MKKSILQYYSFKPHFTSHKTTLKRIFGVFVFMLTCHSLSAQGDHISLGIGPSLIYTDNAGEYSAFRFKIEPAITLSYNKQINEFVGLRGSIGAQRFNSGGFDPLNSKYVINWGNKDQAFDFKGIGYLADFMPIVTTNPNASGKLTSTLQFYAGLGLGAMFVDREQQTLKNGVLMNGELVEGNIITSDETSVIPYVPIKTGISSNLSGDWDFAVEFVLMTTINSEMDGNNIKTKTFAPDMSGQILFTVKRYIGPAW